MNTRKFIVACLLATTVASHAQGGRKKSAVPASPVTPPAASGRTQPFFSPALPIKKTVRNTFPQAWLSGLDTARREILINYLESIITVEDNSYVFNIDGNSVKISILHNDSALFDEILRVVNRRIDALETMVERAGIDPSKVVERYQLLYISWKMVTQVYPAKNAQLHASIQHNPNNVKTINPSSEITAEEQRYLDFFSKRFSIFGPEMVLVQRIVRSNEKFRKDIVVQSSDERIANEIHKLVYTALIFGRNVDYETPDEIEAVLRLLSNLQLNMKKTAESIKVLFEILSKGLPTKEEVDATLDQNPFLKNRTKVSWQTYFEKDALRDPRFIWLFGYEKLEAAKKAFSVYQISPQDLIPSGRQGYFLPALEDQRAIAMLIEAEKAGETLFIDTSLSSGESAINYHDGVAQKIILAPNATFGVLAHEYFHAIFDQTLLDIFDFINLSFDQGQAKKAYSALMGNSRWRLMAIDPGRMKAYLESKYANASYHLSAFEYVKYYVSEGFGFPAASESFACDLEKVVLTEAPVDALYVVHRKYIEEYKLIWLLHDLESRQVRGADPKPELYQKLKAQKEAAEKINFISESNASLVNKKLDEIFGPISGAKSGYLAFGIPWAYVQKTVDLVKSAYQLTKTKISDLKRQYYEQKIAQAQAEENAPRPNEDEIWNRIRSGRKTKSSGKIKVGDTKFWYRFDSKTFLVSEYNPYDTPYFGDFLIKADYDPTQERLVFYIHLKARQRGGDIVHSKFLSGKRAFQEILEYYEAERGVKVRSVHMEWENSSYVLHDSYDQFKQLVELGNSEEEAAKKTWFGQRLVENKFVYVVRLPDTQTTEYVVYFHEPVRSPMTIVNFIFSREPLVEGQQKVAIPSTREPNQQSAGGGNWWANAKASWKRLWNRGKANNGDVDANATQSRKFYSPNAAAIEAEWVKAVISGVKIQDDKSALLRELNGNYTGAALARAAKKILEERNLAWERGAGLEHVMGKAAFEALRSEFHRMVREMLTTSKVAVTENLVLLNIQDYGVTATLTQQIDYLFAVIGIEIGNKMSEGKSLSTAIGEAWEEIKDPGHVWSMVGFVGASASISLATRITLIVKLNQAEASQIADLYEPKVASRWMQWMGALGLYAGMNVQQVMLGQYNNEKYEEKLQAKRVEDNRGYYEADAALRGYSFWIGGMLPVGVEVDAAAMKARQEKMFDKNHEDTRKNEGICEEVEVFGQRANRRFLVPPIERNYWADPWANAACSSEQAMTLKMQLEMVNEGEGFGRELGRINQGGVLANTFIIMFSGAIAYYLLPVPILHTGITIAIAGVLESTYKLFFKWTDEGDVIDAQNEFAQEVEGLALANATLMNTELDDGHLTVNFVKDQLEGPIEREEYAGYLIDVEMQKRRAMVQVALKKVMEAAVWVTRELTTNSQVQMARKYEGRSNQYALVVETEEQGAREVFDALKEIENNQDIRCEKPNFKYWKQLEHPILDLRCSVRGLQEFNKWLVQWDLHGDNSRVHEVVEMLLEMDYDNRWNMYVEGVQTNDKELQSKSGDQTIETRVPLSMMLQDRLSDSMRWLAGSLEPVPAALVQSVTTQNVEDWRWMLLQLVRKDGGYNPDQVLQQAAEEKSKTQGEDVPEVQPGTINNEQVKIVSNGREWNVSLPQTADKKVKVTVYDNEKNRMESAKSPAITMGRKKHRAPTKAEKGILVSKTYVITQDAEVDIDFGHELTPGRYYVNFTFPDSNQVVRKYVDIE